MTSILFTGFDVTSIALRSIFLQLLHHPATLDHFLHEPRDEGRSGELSDPVSFEHAEAWPYL